MKVKLLYCILFLSVTLSAQTGIGWANDIPDVPDYADLASWASLPSIPDKGVDVFYVYPTIYSDQSPLNMDFGRADLRKTVQNLLTTQAGVYSKVANLYAPYYRQMSMAALDSSSDMYRNVNFRIGAEDVARAFDYYLEHLNQSRPFILAGHSQGSMALIDLMRSRFNDPSLQKRLVAAYLIGYSVTESDLHTYPWMKAAHSADDLGVIVSYNTEAPGATSSPVLLPGAICINPLNWKTTGEIADKSLNLGTVFFADGSTRIEKEIPSYTGAQIDNKTCALLTNPPDKLDVGGFPPGVYHKFDYALWYRNLQANVAERVGAFLEK